MQFHLYVESKEQYKQTNKTETNSVNTENRLTGARAGRGAAGGLGLGEKCKGTEKYTLE